MIPIRRTPPLTFLPILLAIATGASASDVEDAVDYRQGLMNVLSWNAERMAAMAKGEVPFDAAAFRGFASDLAAAASLDVLKGFPEDTVTDESDAKDEIWLEWADFQSKLKDLRTQSAKLAEVSHSGDEAAMKAQFEETRGTCKACHKAYKQ